MARIRAKNTRPEMRVRRALWAAGLRYRLHDRRLPGCPDLVFPSLRTVVQIQGCFWHAHEGCANFRLPKTRSEWWATKLERNKARDVDVRAKLESAGWRVLVIWECETTGTASVTALIEKLRSSRASRVLKVKR
jgi:DNA mismatch endonuclease (patch repair protein)